MGLPTVENCRPRGILGGDLGGDWTPAPMLVGPYSNGVEVFDAVQPATAENWRFVLAEAYRLGVEGRGPESLSRIEYSGNGDFLSGPDAAVGSSIPAVFVAHRRGLVEHDRRRAARKEALDAAMTEARGYGAVIA
jgi:hypothetical protein